MYANQAAWDYAAPDESGETLEMYVDEQVALLLDMQDAAKVTANDYLDALSEVLGDLEGWNNERPLTQVFLLAAQGKQEAAEKLANSYRHRAVNLAEKLVREAV